MKTLSITEQKVLIALKEQEECTPTKIYKRYDISQAVVYKAIRKLIKIGYIEQKARDGRSYNVRLNAKGIDLMNFMSQDGKTVKTRNS